VLVFAQGCGVQADAPRGLGGRRASGGLARMHGLSKVCIKDVSKVLYLQGVYPRLVQQICVPRGVSTPFQLVQGFMLSGCRAPGDRLP
jgi:hypothetical protein